MKTTDHNRTGFLLLPLKCCVALIYASVVSRLKKVHIIKEKLMSVDFNNLKVFISQLIDFKVESNLYFELATILTTNHSQSYQISLVSFLPNNSFLQLSLFLI